MTNQLEIRLVAEAIDAQIIQVFVRNGDGSEVMPLTELPSGNGHPDWAQGVWRNAEEGIS